eukprot:TRINITY_DN13041_c0_g1_i1.p1 TRINITY_DN13041_c0_g1~~TRINITY_DN13041_c0_g1_i1.p1  ORF type:complete len:294 (-),score=65.39 TRINITY_DN13041_c0_g1_i1:20-901(-)
MARRTLRSLLLALLLAGGLPSPAGGTCRLPVTFPRTARPSGATAGPGNTLIFASGSGTLLFLDLDDYSMREDTALNDKYQDMYGSFDLQGLAMSDTLSNYVYFVAQGKASVFQYDFKDTRRIVRRFDLPGFSGSSAAGAESLTWVPTQASPHGGYFYVGSQLAGQVFVYELPINDDSAPVVSGDSKQLMTIWTPLKESQTVAGLSYSGGYLFVNYDERYSNHVLIYPILPNGLPGELKEQYQVDVSNAEGLVARQSDGKSWVADAPPPAPSEDVPMAAPAPATASGEQTAART